MKEDIECKHQELQNLMRIQENLTRRNDLPVDGTAESLIKNWKDTNNKLYYMLYIYFTWQKEWLSKGYTELTSEITQNKDLVQPIPSQCSLFIPPENIIKPHVFRGYHKQTLVRNGLVVAKLLT